MGGLSLSNFPSPGSDPAIVFLAGCLNPAEEIVRLAHSVGAKVLLDACQSVPHMPVDVQALDADWLVASGHKVRGVAETFS